MQFACKVVWWKEYWAPCYVVFLWIWFASTEWNSINVVKLDSGRKLLLDYENCFEKMSFIFLFTPQEGNRLYLKLQFTHVKWCMSWAFTTSGKQCFTKLCWKFQRCCNCYETIWRHNMTHTFLILFNLCYHHNLSIFIFISALIKVAHCTLK